MIGVPEGVAAELRPIGEEASRLEESARYSAQGQFEQVKIWRMVNLLLGVPSAVLAAVGGARVLADAGHRWLTAALSLGAATLTATLTTVNAARRAERAYASASAYLDIQTDARQFILVDLVGMSLVEARARLAELTQRRSGVNGTADPPMRWAYRRARRNIGSGGQTYDVDRQPPVAVES